MARVQVAAQPWGVLQDRYGNALQNQTLVVRNLDGSTAGIFAAQTGGTAISPVSNDRGYVAGWIEEGDYLVTDPKGQVLTVTAAATNRDIGVDVTKFGADPTGVADSTTAFQDAHDYLAALDVGIGGRRRIIVPDGTYLLNGPSGQPLSSGGHSWCVSWFADNLELDAGPNVEYRTTVAAHTFFLGGNMKGADPTVGDPLNWPLRWLNNPAVTTVYDLTGTYALGDRSITLASAGDAANFAVDDWIFVRSGQCDNGGVTQQPDSELNQVAGISGAVITLRFALSKSYEQEQYVSTTPTASSPTNVGSAAIFGVSNVNDRVLLAPKIRGGRFVSTQDVTFTNPGGVAATPWPIFAMGVIDMEFSPDPGSEVATLIGSVNVDRNRIWDPKRIHHTGAAPFDEHMVFNADVGSNNARLKPVVATCETGTCYIEVHEGAANTTIDPGSVFINPPDCATASLASVSLGGRVYGLELGQITIVNGPSAFWTILTQNQADPPDNVTVAKNHIRQPKLTGQHGTKGIWNLSSDSFTVDDPDVVDGAEVRISNDALHVTPKLVGADETLNAGVTPVAGYEPYYLRFDDGLVHMRGVLENTSGGTLASGTVLFTLPSTYRPYKLIDIKNKYDAAATARTVLGGDGTLTLFAGVTSGTFVSVDQDFWATGL